MFSIQLKKSVFSLSFLFLVLSACGGASAGKGSPDPVGNASSVKVASSKSQASSVSQVSLLASSVGLSSLSSQPISSLSSMSSKSMSSSSSSSVALSSLKSSSLASTSVASSSKNSVSSASSSSSSKSSVSSASSSSSSSVLACATGGFLNQSKLLVGGSMQDTSANAAPFDARYLYLAGGVRQAGQCANSCDGTCGQWWGCWNQPMGQYAVYFMQAAANATWQNASRPQIPVFTYYEWLQSAQGFNNSIQEGAGQVAVANDANFLKLYLDDWRVLLQTIGTTKVLLHVEPDLWAYARIVNANPHLIPAQVTAANPTDCSAQENSMSGVASCMIGMTRKYAPNAKIGLHASPWLIGNTGDGDATGNFMAALGAGAGDFMVTDVSDRDAGYYQSIGQNRFYSDADHVNFLTWSKSVSTVVGKPMIIWQIPLGNMNQNNTNDHWKDNHVDYFFAHLSDVTSAKVVALLFGAGAGAQTTIETDGNNLINKTISNWQAGGQNICQ